MILGCERCTACSGAMPTNSPVQVQASTRSTSVLYFKTRWQPIGTGGPYVGAPAFAGYAACKRCRKRGNDGFFGHGRDAGGYVAVDGLCKASGIAGSLLVVRLGALGEAVFAFVLHHLVNRCVDATAVDVLACRDVASPSTLEHGVCVGGSACSKGSSQIDCGAPPSSPPSCPLARERAR